MYCSKCGSQLPDGAKFCHNCGAALSGAGQSAPPPPQPVYPKQRPGWLVPVIAAVCVLLLLIVIGIAAVVVIHVTDKAAPEPSGAALPELSLTPEAGDTGDFERYENGDVEFAIDYPPDFEYSEPNLNNVLFTKGDSCRVAVEYAYMTTRNSFIYSAQDFADQLQADPEGFSEWIGSEGARLLNTGSESHGGLDCVAMTWELEGGNCDGALYAFDSQGAFGCYVVMTMVERDAGETLRQQVEAMLESFEITGPHEPKGYTLHEVEEYGLRFALRDEFALGGVDVDEDRVMIKPVDGSYNHSSIRIDTNSVYKPDRDTVDEAIESCYGYYLKYRDNAQLLAQPARIEAGRYDFTQAQVEFYEDGERHVCCDVLFPYNGEYWELTMLTSQENQEATAEAMEDVLASLCFDGGEIGRTYNTEGSVTKPQVSGQEAKDADMNRVIDDVLKDIEGRDGYVEPGVGYEPLASFTDIDGNGVYELLALYKVKLKDGTFRVLYDVYSVKNDGSCEVLTNGGELYDEVGGNGGSLGLVVDKAKKPYLKLETKSPQGDRFNNMIMYLPWNESQSGYDNYSVYLEGHGVYGEEDDGRYIIGEEKTDRAGYEARQAEFMSLWTDLNLSMGPGNGGNNMSFEQIRTLDMNEYTFNSVG